MSKSCPSPKELAARLGTLTKRQEEVLMFICAFIADMGFPPTRTEICREFKFSSRNAAEEHLRAIEKKGVIRLVPGVSRGIQFVGNGNRENVEAFFNTP